MAKKPVKKIVRKAAPKAAPVAAPAATPCAGTCACGCRGGRFLKKLLVFLVIFALGFCACKFLCCCCGKHEGFRGPKPEFVNGCLDVNRDISRMNEMALKHIEGLRNMDADVNGCITPEEFKAAKKSMWKHKKEARAPEAPAGAE